jgi:hypothetical protein
VSGALYGVKMARCRICGVTLYEPSEEEYREICRHLVASTCDLFMAVNAGFMRAFAGFKRVSSGPDGPCELQYFEPGEVDIPDDTVCYFIHGWHLDTWLYLTDDLLEVEYE